MKEKIKDFDEFHSVVALYFYGLLTAAIGSSLFIIFYLNNQYSLEFPFLIYFFAAILFVWSFFLIRHAYKRVFDSAITMWLTPNDANDFWMLIPFIFTLPIAWVLWKLKR